MQREVEILRDMRTAAIAPLQEEKAALTGEYETLIRTLADEPETLATISTAMRAEFVRVADQFEAALAENERALYAARTAQSRLIKAIVEAVGKERDKTSAYSASGAIEASQRHDPARPLGFDARL